ncbi:MAG: hypothetical protein Q8L87_02395 [Anaerolineales bacterium]|nr:hypothetical protein [Anaerolineales bacterium]
MKDIIEKIMADPIYKKNIEFGEPRYGHPEGKVKYHIADLESNLEELKKQGRIRTEEEYWKLKFMIHVHDLFKADAGKDTPTLHPRNHAFLASKYAAQFIDDTDLLNMIQYHDENYKLWKQFIETRSYDLERFQNLLSTIRNWDLFLLFIIIDGCTNGKDHSKLGWFIAEVGKYKTIRVEPSWVLPLR